MESENKNLLQKSIDVKDQVKLEARRRYKRLILVFKLLFFALILIIGALIIYLVRDIASESQSDSSIHLNYPTDQTFDNTESQIFDTQSLDRAAEQLEDALKYLASNTDTSTLLALKMCRISLLNGSGQIRRAVAANRLITTNQIRRVEDNMRACVDDLETVESTAVIEVRAEVLRVMVYLRDWRDFVDENIWPKKLWGLVMENLFVACAGGLQLPFIIYLLWAFFKFG